MRKIQLIAAIVCLLSCTQPIAPPASAALDSDIRSKLAASRDALVAQLRDIKGSYDDVSKQIDELRRKQALLDSYRRETETAIAEIERAMAQTR